MNQDQPKTPKKFGMKRSHLIFLAFFAIGLIAAKLWQYHWPDATIELKGQQLHVQVAQNRYQLRKGLSNRKSLGKYDGMIFLFSREDKHGFVMRGMQFPLDIIWFDNGTVVDIAPNLPPEAGRTESQLTHYYPRKPANIVLEVPAGWAKEHSLAIGDTLTVIDE